MGTSVGNFASNSAGNLVGNNQLWGDNQSASSLGNLAGNSVGNLAGDSVGNLAENAVGNLVGNSEGQGGGEKAYLRKAVIG